jgi:predicted ester cyclase
MSLENKKAVLRRFYEMWEGRSRTQVEDVCAPHYLDHMPHPGRTHLEGVKHAVHAFRRAFPDGTNSVEMIAAEGELVTGHGVFRGTQTGWFFDIPPTGRKVEISTLDVVRIEDGKIVEIWHLEDQMKLLRQLGIMPPQKGG